jgi:tRNA-specific 2-thiouridylase
MLYEKIDKQLKADVKIRYKDTPSEAVIEQISESTVKVILNEPKKSITPGQSAVFYEKGNLIGGGIIDYIIK